MTDENRPGMTEEERDDRWARAWEAASEFERRRFERLEDQDKLYVLILVPTGEVATLGEAVSMADGAFERSMRRKRVREQK